MAVQSHSLIASSAKPRVSNENSFGASESERTFVAPKVIGFCGFAGAGKTTAARVLMGAGYVRERFAGPLKDMLRALGLSEAEVDGNLKEVPCALLGGATPRHAMQQLGTRWGRDAIHPDLWTRVWGARVDQHLRAGQSVVCDDIRFPNEAESVRARGGLIIKITSEGAKQASTHVSELIPFAWDFEVENNGTVEDLAARLEETVGTREMAA